MASLFQVAAVLVVLRDLHTLAPFPMLLTLLLDMHLFHHLTEQVALRLEHAFLLVPSALVQFLLQIYLFHTQFANAFPCLWPFHSNKSLLYLPQLPPFSPFMPDIGPDTIKCYPAEFLLSH